MVNLLAVCLPISPVVCNLFKHVLMLLTESPNSADMLASDVTS